jgi:hypothetical protein
MGWTPTSLTTQHRRRTALGLRPMTFDLLPGDWTQERPARPRPHLPGRLFGQLTDSGRTRTLDFSASGPRIGAWMVCPPTRRGIRTAAPGSCAERRFQDRRRLISEAGAENHISPRPSCSVSLHHELAKLIPAAGAHRWSAAGVVPAAGEVRAQSHPRASRAHASRNGSGGNAPPRCSTPPIQLAGISSRHLMPSAAKARSAAPPSS